MLTIYYYQNLSNISNNFSRVSIYIVSLFFQATESQTNFQILRYLFQKIIHDFCQ